MDVQMAKKSKAFDHSKYANWIDPNKVVPYEKNAKIHDDKQIKNIANSIKRFGWQQDVVITADNVLVIGHGRRLAAIKLGCEMPYHVIDKTADELTDEDIRELRIADNQTNAETGFDFDALANDIDGLDFEGFDFDFCIDDYPSNEDVEGGSVEDKEKEKVAVKIIFENVRDWRKHEENLRKFIDEFENVSISVGGFEDENKQGDA